MSVEDDFYEKFRKQLNEGQELPGDYVFKFILENNNQQIANLQKIFDAARPNISSKLSKNKKYNSITIKVFVLDEEEIIQYYKEASKIEGIISL